MLMGLIHKTPSDGWCFSLFPPPSLENTDHFKCWVKSNPKNWSTEHIMSRTHLGRGTMAASSTFFLAGFIVRPWALTLNLTLFFTILAFWGTSPADTDSPLFQPPQLSLGNLPSFELITDINPDFAPSLTSLSLSFYSPARGNSASNSTWLRLTPCVPIPMKTETFEQLTLWDQPTASERECFPCMRILILMLPLQCPLFSCIL